MKYIKLRFKFWRIRKAIEKGEIITIARLLDVTISDKTVTAFGKELERKHKEFCDELIQARWWF